MHEYKELQTSVLNSPMLEIQAANLRSLGAAGVGEKSTLKVAIFASYFVVFSYASFCSSCGLGLASLSITYCFFCSPPSYSAYQRLCKTLTIATNGGLSENFS